jgi:hypothetical protein
VTARTEHGALVTGAARASPAPSTLTRREARWVLRRCGHRGHVLAHLNDPVAARFEGAWHAGTLLRCLRCGTFVDPRHAGTYPGVVLGAAAARVPLGEVPLVLRGAHGRKIAVLRLLAVERLGRGLLLLLLAVGIGGLATRHVQVAGITPHPMAAFMQQCARQLTDPFDGFLLGKRYLLHDAEAFAHPLVHRGLHAPGGNRLAVAISLTIIRD